MFWIHSGLMISRLTCVKNKVGDRIDPWDVVVCQNNEVRFVGSLIHCLILNILKIIVLNCQKCGVPA